MRESTPEHVLSALKKGALAPFYLFYGPEDFWIELTLDKIKKDFLPDTVKGFNLETMYGGETAPQEILGRAQSLPFMAAHRLLIVRGTENFGKGELDLFLPYLEHPVDSTCLIWLSSKANFTMAFYKRIRESGRAVQFKRLTERQIYAWIQERARDLEIAIDKDASAFLVQLVGTGLRDLFSELSKLSLRHPKSRIGVEEIKELTIFSRLFTVFDMVDAVSRKDAPQAMKVLGRLFETQGRDSGAALGVLSMLARQFRLLLKTKAGLKREGGTRGVTERLKPLPPFVIEKCIAQEAFWRERELEEALHHVYDADGLIKEGSKGDLIVESLIFRLCYPPTAPQTAGSLDG
jgi:DNA polymerase-3 subunit delta